MDSQLQELITFLSMNQRPDIQIIALQSLLDLSGDVETLKNIMTQSDLLMTLVSLLNHENFDVAKRASLILVNISAQSNGPQALLSLSAVNSVLSIIINPDSPLSDACCMILSNITRQRQHSDIVIDLMNKDGVTLDKLFDVFTKNQYNNKKQNLFYLGPVLSNLSQCPSIRALILDQNKCIVQKLLPFTEFSQSIVKRGGAVGTLRNCCFETEHHAWLLSENVDILPRLLLPLAGNAEYDDEDNEKLPTELQYLPDDKVREQDPDIRCMLLETITQLCASRPNREFVRDKNTYVILRELHKWETDRKALLACENLVDILIRTEEEIGVDNLLDVDIPEDLHEKFEAMDRIADT